VQVPPVLPESDKEKTEFEAAKLRREMRMKNV